MIRVTWLAANMTSWLFAYLRESGSYLPDVKTDQIELCTVPVKLTCIDAAISITTSRSVLDLKLMDKDARSVRTLETGRETQGRECIWDLFAVGQSNRLSLGCRRSYSAHCSHLDQLQVRMF